MLGKEAPVADWVTISELYRDPFPIYERLRAEGGVHWVPQVGRYLITSYAAVHETELNQEVYSANEEGSLQIRAMGHSMLRKDDPEHHIERRAWQPMLRPGAVKRIWTSTFERNAAKYLDELVEKGPGADLVWDFAAPYAAESLREIIGLHNATQQDMQRWSQTMIDATGNYADDPDVWALGKKSFDEVDDALDEMLQWHAQNPNDSLLSHLLQIPDYKMPLESIRANVKMSIGGGLNEPRDAMGVASWALLTHPDQRAAVEADPGLWNSVFDESIRWVAPIGLYSRQVTQDTVLNGVRLPAGAKLGICLLAANRDENVWDAPQEFDIRREVKPHLAFGKGVHVCLGAWVARAEVAEVALPMLFSQLKGLALVEGDEPEIGGWVFRGMNKLPVTWKSRSTAAPAASKGAAQGPAPRVAIVGSGPAGSFTAQALNRRFPEAQIDVFDALPTPYGLVRYGVAADHQGTKAVTRQFDRVYADKKVTFRGNVRLGVDYSLDELGHQFDVTVLATGMREDAGLAVPGSQLAGVHGAGSITRQLNSYPDEPQTAPLGQSVVVVGHGNVAIDIVRLIVRDAEGFAGSDVDDAARGRLADGVKTVHVVGRSGPANAKFDPVMVREIAVLPGVQHVVHGAGDLPGDGKDARLDAVKMLQASTSTTAGEATRVRVEWWFGLTPTEFEGSPDSTGDDRVTAAVFAGSGGEVRIPASSVITAVGFAANADSPVEPGSHASGCVKPGLYTAGWLRRGPRGTIPDQRADARELVQTIAQHIEEGAVSIGAPGLPPLDAETSFDGWRRIDAVEQLSAAAGRERAKLTSVEAMLQTAADTSVALAPLTQVATSVLEARLPVTILFGTESGGAELVAEELRQLFAEDADVLVQDIAATSASALDRARFHLLVCSTYGDGEVPTSVQPFLDALTASGPALDGLHYAVFGMGDRSYDRTYSRGSELLDEALQSCGATRVGEYGRHDAGGSIEAVEMARDWAQSVIAEAAASAAVSG